MKLLIIFTILFICTLVSAKQIRVAVIDTGINQHLNLPLCLGDHKTFMEDDLHDSVGHGSIVAEIINREAKGVDYCIVVIKVFDKDLNYKFEEGIEYASTLNIDFVNISGGGSSYSVREKLAIDKMIRNGTIVVVAAGNHGVNLDYTCNFFPACYDSKVVVVGQKDNPRSNYGKKVVMAPGKVVLIDGKTMEGSSMATAYITGNLIRVKGHNVRSN